MKKITTVIFDMDGTLLDTLDDLRDSINYIMRKYGYGEYSRAEISNFVGNGLANLMERALPGGRENPDFDKIFEEFKAYYGQHCNDLTGPYRNIPELIAELCVRGYKMAIVSNKAHYALTELVKIYFPNITVAIGEREGVNKKPAPDTVVAALSELGSTREESVYVGDSEVDIATAKNSGLYNISCAWGFRGREVLEALGAKTIIDDPLELLGILDNM